MTFSEIGDRAAIAGFFPVPALMAGQMAMKHPNGLAVLVSIAPHVDGKRWVHVSLSFAKLLPSWDMIVFVRDATIGRDKKAVQVIAPESEHVNIHPNVHHFFHCLDEDPLPDFTRGSGSL